MYFLVSFNIKWQMTVYKTRSPSRQTNDWRLAVQTYYQSSITEEIPRDNKGENWLGERGADGDFDRNAGDRFTAISDGWFDDMTSQDRLVSDSDFTVGVERDLNGGWSVSGWEGAMIWWHAQHAADVSWAFSCRLQHKPACLTHNTCSTR